MKVFSIATLVACLTLGCTNPFASQQKIEELYRLKSVEFNTLFNGPLGSSSILLKNQVFYSNEDVEKFSTEYPNQYESLKNSISQVHLGPEMMILATSSGHGKNFYIDIASIQPLENGALVHTIVWLPDSSSIQSGVPLQSLHLVSLKRIDGEIKFNTPLIANINLRGVFKK